MSALPAQPVEVTRKQPMKLAGSGDESERKLTRLEGKILELLLNPDTRHAKRQELYKMAGCSKGRYYAILKDPWFDQQRREGLQAIIREQTISFVRAAAKTAATPGRDGFQDRRLLLSMTGDHVERRHHDHNVTGRVVVGVIGVAMEDLG